MSLRVLLVRPPYLRIRGAGQAPFFPLGAGALAAVLRQEGHHVRIYLADAPAPGEEPPAVRMEEVFHARRDAARRMRAALTGEHPVWEEAAEVLRSERPDWVGISALSVEAGAGARLAAIARREAPEARIAWGGAHATFMAREVLERGWADLVIQGEGERTWPELLETVAAGGDPGDVPGVLVPGRETPTRDAPLLEDLDALPLPARDLCLFPDRQSPTAMGVLMSSRGCPYDCGFCSSRRLWRCRVRFRSPRAVVEEMREVELRYGTRLFTFWDDTFTLDRDRALALCEEILSSGIKAVWRTATRADLLDLPLLRLMRRAGCVQLEVGIESGSPRISELIRKEIDLDRVPEAIRLVTRAGIAVGAFFMAGFPDETAEELDQTFRLMRTIQPTELVLNVFDPMPGSDLYDRCQELGLLPDPLDWEDMPLWPERHYLAGMAPEEFNRRVAEISRYVFRYNRRLSTLLRKARPQAASLIRRDPALLARKALRFLRLAAGRGRV